MSTDSGPDGFDPADALTSVAMDVSRAHLLLSGTRDWVPRPVRTHTDEALDILERAIIALRDVAAVLHDAPAQPHQQRPHARHGDQAG